MSHEPRPGRDTGQGTVCGEANHCSFISYVSGRQAAEEQLSRNAIDTLWYVDEERERENEMSSAKVCVTQSHG